MRKTLWLVIRTVCVVVTVLLAVGMVVTLVATPAGPVLIQTVRKAVDNATVRTTSTRQLGPVIVERLHKVNRLETARQVNHHVIEAKSNSPLLGDFLSQDRIVMTVFSEAIAGVDLSKLSDTDVALQGGKVLIHMPAPELFYVRIDNTRSQVLTRDRGLLVFTPDPELERQARLQAEKQAREAALQAGILGEARRNAESNVRALLKSLHFDNVQFVDATPAAAE